MRDLPHISSIMTLQEVKLISPCSFAKRGKHLLIAQIYVDDIVFGATVDSHTHTFASKMKKVFKMSMIGELTYLLCLQVQQLDDGIFVSQAKDLVMKFGLDEKSHIVLP